MHRLLLQRLLVDLLIFLWSFRIEIDTKLPIVGDQKWVIWICSFNVPMAPGKTRSIVCSARNFFQFTMPGPAWWQVKDFELFLKMLQLYWINFIAVLFKFT